jgi:phage replication-related protein YjqB (UPF0714/DUF867 family)
MKLFDVMVYDDRRLMNVAYQQGLVKREAKRICKALTNKGFKSHVLTTKEGRELANFHVDTTPQNYDEDEE